MSGPGGASATRVMQRRVTVAAAAAVVVVVALRLWADTFSRHISLSSVRSRRVCHIALPPFRPVVGIVQSNDMNEEEKREMNYDTMSLA